MPKVKLKFKDVNDLMKKLNVDIDTLNDYVSEITGKVVSDISYTSKSIVINARYIAEDI